MKDFAAVLTNSVQAQLQTALYAVPVLVAAGIAAYFAWPYEPTLAPPALLAIFTLLLALILRRYTDLHGGKLILWFMLLAIFWIVTGFATAKIRTDFVKTPLLAEKIGPVWTKGTIRSLEQFETGKGVRIVLEDLKVKAMPPERTPDAVRLSIRKGYEPLRVGQRIGLMAVAEPPSPPSIPGGFDFRRHAYFKQIGGYGYGLGSPRIFEEPAETGWVGVFEATRNRIAGNVAVTLPARQAGMVSALLTGERAAIAEDDWNALRASGLAHLLAISGANVDMVALIIFFIARLLMACVPRLALYHPIKKYAALIAFVVTLGYVLLILPSTPTLRAMVTITIVLFAILIDRSPISLRLVAVTATLILLVQPEQLLSPSFQLSFAAVTALVAVFEWIGPWLSTLHRDSGFFRRIFIYVAGVGGTTVIATLATAPISLFHFQNLAVYGVLANALAVPLMTFFIMPLAVLAYPLMATNSAGPVLQVLGLGCDWVLDIARATAGLPGAVWTPPALPPLAFTLIVSAGVTLCGAARIFKTLAVIPLLAALIVIFTHDRADMMISENAKLVMINDGRAVWASSLRAERRLREDWMRYWGVSDVQKMPKGACMEQICKIEGQSFPFPNIASAKSPVAIWFGTPPRVAPVALSHGRSWETP